MSGPQIDFFVLAVGGVDPGGGSGLLRDAFTAVARGARPLIVGTAWTDQGPDVHRVEARAPESVLAALRQALARRPAAVKVGMVPDAGVAAAIVEALGAFEGPVVVDPVLATSRGGALWRGAAGDLFPLLRRATVVTPNAREAEALAGVPVGDLEGAARAARALADRGLPAVLVKGGHLGAAPAPVTDTLVEGTRLHRLEHPRVGGGDVRGTGCALATALAVELGRGVALVPALEAATAWLAGAIASAVDVAGERQLPSG